LQSAIWHIKTFSKTPYGKILHDPWNYQDSGYEGFQNMGEDVPPIDMLKFSAATISTANSGFNSHGDENAVFAHGHIHFQQGEKTTYFHRIFHVYDRSGRHCGFMYDPKISFNFWEPGNKLVVLSKMSPTSLLHALSINTSRRYESPYFNHNEFEARQWCILNVMLVKNCGGHVERITIGAIHEDAWNDARPEHEQVILG
jgi:hypothetical protein